MTAREPSAVEVIADSAVGTQVGGGGYDWASVDRPTALAMAQTALAALKAAGFVVATRDEIRAMSPSEQAELIGGRVEWGAKHARGVRAEASRKSAEESLSWLPRGREYEMADPRAVVARVVTPWREVQP